MLLLNAEGGVVIARAGGKKKALGLGHSELFSKMPSITVKLKMTELHQLALLQLLGFSAGSEAHASCIFPLIFEKLPLLVFPQCVYQSPTLLAVLFASFMMLWVSRVNIARLRKAALNTSH